MVHCVRKNGGGSKAVLILTGNGLLRLHNGDKKVLFAMNGAFGVYGAFFGSSD